MGERLLAGSRQIELIKDPEGGPYQHVLFDFDGTLSLLREGWRSIMIPMMVDVLARLDTEESNEELTACVTEFVDTLTGQQTIYQMIRLAEEVRERGGSPEKPIAYKELYHNRLLDHIQNRREGLKQGCLTPEAFLVPGTQQLLGALFENGLDLYLASGTDHKYVVEEAELLGISDFFEGKIYGARDDYKSFSKAHLIEQILSQPQIEGRNLLGFGDGYVEIQNVANASGTAIGVATNEAERQGVDEWKRERLINAGASIIIPDYREQNILLEHLF